uniref:Bidirectional sugar transporter SWEET n=2 Tax=Opuntia streptacantha TaxID=393608 RepID=A0A7C8Z9C5_OPUST
MGDKLRIALGVMGNAASVLLFAAPMLTFSRIINKRSTQDFSCVPYIVALVNCLIYIWYGLPIVSCGWENFPLIPINGLGILLESSFIAIYLWFASPSGKVKVTAMTVPAIALFCMSALISAFLFHDHHRRKVFVGTVGLVASSAMYGSPLVAVKKVIQTKSVEYMPFSLSFFSFLASSIWMAYGLLSHDLLLASPNMVGWPLSILQLVLYCKYRREKGEETNELDLEKSTEEPKQVQLVTDGNINVNSELHIQI